MCQYNLTQSREGAKKVLARPAIVKTPTVILNLFQDLNSVRLQKVRC